MTEQIIEDGKHYCSKCGDQLTVCDWGFGTCDACKSGPDISMLGHKSMLDAFVAAEEEDAKAKNLRRKLRVSRTAAEKKILTGRIERGEQASQNHRRSGKRIKQSQRHKAMNKGSILPEQFFGPEDRRTNIDEEENQNDE